MTLQRILPLGLLLLTAFGVAGSARADHNGAVNGLVARLHGQANAVESQIRGGFRRSNHYSELNQYADNLHDQVDQLRANLRNGASVWQLRRDALQVNQAVVQLDRLVEHVEQDIRRGTCSLSVNPELVHRQIHQMRRMSQELLNYFPAPTITQRPTWGGGSGFGGGYGGSGFGGCGVCPQPGFSFGGGSGGLYLGGHNWGIQFGR